MTSIRWIASIAFATLVAGISSSALADCAGDAAWLPTTPPPTNAQPEDPLADCSAYRWAWQTFLYLTETGSNQAARFLGYDDMDTVFGSGVPISIAARIKPFELRPRTVEEQGPVIDNGIVQAGGVDGVLVDQNGNPVYYAIHMNMVYVNFVLDRKLNDKPSLKATDPQTTFPVGSVELKSSWQVVDASKPPADYLTTTAQVPTLTTDSDGKIVADPKKLRTVTVALLGLHVVGVIENHPEFIWASFEHDDLAPAAQNNPAGTDPAKELSDKNWTLYAAHTPASEADTITDNLTLDPATQKLSPATSVYRQFPGSSNSSSAVDDEVSDINASMLSLFGSVSSDVRSHYHLVGAIWLKNGAKDFALSTNFSSHPDLLAGENAMSNMSIESFTQVNSPNCFSCHTTTASAGLPPMKINISHILPLFNSKQ